MINQQLLSNITPWNAGLIFFSLPLLMAFSPRLHFPANFCKTSVIGADLSNYSLPVMA
jgi:hypothetical protein